MFVLVYMFQVISTDCLYIIQHLSGLYYIMQILISKPTVVISYVLKNCELVEFVFL